jgi:SAM-dependent methyltransferase
MRPSIPAFAATDPDIYERFMGRWSARMADPFLSFAGVESGQRVLDVGCGTGIITLALAQRGCTAVGVDASEAYLAGARHRRSHPAITYEHGDAQSLAHATASFDASVSLLAIDVIPEPEKAAAEMRRVTRPGGVVACGTSDFGGGNYSFLMLLDIGAVFNEGISCTPRIPATSPTSPIERPSTALAADRFHRCCRGAYRGELRL